MQNAFVAITIAVLMSGVSAQRLIAQPQAESGKVDGNQQQEFIVQKLTPFATEVNRPSEWFFRQDHKGGNYTWVISEDEPDKASRKFETGVEIKAFYNVSRVAKQSPEDFAAEYLETKVKNKKAKTLHRATQKSGPLTALTQTVELGDAISATDLYWGDGKQLDVVVVVTRTSSKEQWSEYQRVFGKLTKFRLRTIVEGTPDKPPLKSGQNQYCSAFGDRDSASSGVHRLLWSGGQLFCSG